MDRGAGGHYVLVFLSLSWLTLGTVFSLSSHLDCTLLPVHKPWHPSEPTSAWITITIFAPDACSGYCPAIPWLWTQLMTFLISLSHTLLTDFLFEHSVVLNQLGLRSPPGVQAIWKIGTCPSFLEHVWNAGSTPGENCLQRRGGKWCLGPINICTAHS